MLPTQCRNSARHAAAGNSVQVNDLKDAAEIPAGTDARSGHQRTKEEELVRVGDRPIEAPTRTRLVDYVHVVVTGIEARHRRPTSDELQAIAGSGCQTEVTMAGWIWHLPVPKPLTSRRRLVDEVQESIRAEQEHLQ